MKVYYNEDKIYYAVPDKDVFYFTPSVNVPLSILSISEIEANRKLCVDLLKYGNTQTIDKDGLSKYRVVAGKIVERTSWLQDDPILREATEMLSRRN